MTTKSGSAKNYFSNLLDHEEADLIVGLLGNRCQALAMAVIQLFLTDPPHHSSWRKHDSGVLCLVKDNQKRSYFFRLYCLWRRQMVWEHEVYNNLDYTSPRPFLHTFECEDSIAAFNFANDDEARHLRNVLVDKLEGIRRRHERHSGQSTSSYQQRTHTQVSPLPSTGNHLSNGIVPVAKQKKHVGASGGRRKEKDSKRRITKADIGLPQGFRHVSHVGMDPNKGFDVDNVEDPQLKQFFAKAGISDSQLQDRETHEFIYDFINRHGGIDAVKNELVFPPSPQMQASAVPPPVPAFTVPSNASFQTRTTPPPPLPSRSGPLPPIPSQPPAVGIHHQPSPSIKPVHPPPPAPAPPSVGAPPPPPPPPPPAIPEAPAAPPPPPMAQPSVPPAAPAGMPDARSALLESIRSGKQLKSVEVENKQPAAGGTRSDLLNQIQQGVELKSVPNTPRPSQTGEPQNGLAGALARALADRSRVIHSDSSASSEEDNDEDEWED